MPRSQIHERVHPRNLVVDELRKKLLAFDAKTQEMKDIAVGRVVTRRGPARLALEKRIKRVQETCEHKSTGDYGFEDYHNGDWHEDIACLDCGARLPASFRP